jgi:hypothetical protein
VLAEFWANIVWEHKERDCWLSAQCRHLRKAQRMAAPSPKLPLAQCPLPINIHTIPQHGPSVLVVAIQARAGNKITRLPTKQIVIPITSHRSGRVPSTIQSQAIELAI